MVLLQTVTSPTAMRRLLLQQPQPIKGGGGEATGAPATDFVVRKGDQLFLRNEPFRFISFNAPDLHVVEDESWHRASLWEQEDALQTIARMGGQVVRIYPMSIVGGLNNGSYTHVLGKGVYNEALFRDLDQMLVVAGRLNVRVIIPFIDHWEWWGGIPQFTKMYNAPFGDFYRSAEVKKGFKDLVKHVVMRRNTLTGRLYRDDPAILAWESGNELNYEDKEADKLSFPLPSRKERDGWMSELAAYIKGLDPNHLVIDGRLLNNRAVSKVQLEDPNIDLISDHFYPNTAFAFEERLAHMVSFTKGHKPFLVGEFGLVAPTTIDDLAKRVIAEPAVAGVPGGRSASQWLWLSAARPTPSRWVPTWVTSSCSRCRGRGRRRAAPPLPGAAPSPRPLRRSPRRPRLPASGPTAAAAAAASRKKRRPRRLRRCGCSPLAAAATTTTTATAKKKKQ